MGDAETIIDADGRLPSERPAMSLTMFKVRRNAEVRDLRDPIAALTSELEQTRGRPERARLGEQIRSKTYRLDRLVAVPPLTASEVRAGCISPAEWHRHGQLGPVGQRPCPAWPRWAARIEKARAMILAAAAKTTEAPDPSPKPGPLAVTPSGLTKEAAPALLAAGRWGPMR